ncbi:MAG: hypothetical protein RR744_09470 [Cellulosilyticaceae bacterium]
MEKHLPPANIQKLRHVQNRVQINCGEVLKVEFDGIEDVYNMEVDTHHNFSVNGGLIIHNCIDACRYGVENEINSKKLKVKSKAKLGIM